MMLEAQREKMHTESAKGKYKLRGQTVEWVFADAQGNRGHDRFHGRGLSRVRAETGLLPLAQNLLLLDKLQRNCETPEIHAAFKLHDLRVGYGLVIRHKLTPQLRL
jgi:hypothetical protein